MEQCGFCRFFGCSLDTALGEGDLIPIKCCNKVVCQKHMKELYINPDKSQIQCCFCKKELNLARDDDEDTLTDEDFQMEKTRIILSDLNDSLNQYEEVKNRPLTFIRNYFEKLKVDINFNRDQNKILIDNYYDELIKKIEHYEEQCVNNDQLDNLPDLINQKLDIDGLRKKREAWNDSFKDSKSPLQNTNELNNEIETRLNDLNGKLDAMKSYLLNYKLYAFESSHIAENDLGKIQMHDKIQDKYRIICTENNLIKICSIDNTKCYKNINNYFTRMVKSLSNRHLISCTFDEKDIKLWDILNVNGPIKIFSVSHSSPVFILRRSDTEFISATKCGTIYLWNVHQETFLRSLYKNGHEEQICCLEMLPNNRLASCSIDKTIRIWDLNQYECVKTLLGHSSSVNYLKLLPENKLISCSDDKTIKVWDLNEFNCRQTLRGHAADICYIELLPNNRIASGSKNAKIKIWNLNTEECIATLYCKYECSNKIKYLKYLGNDRLLSYSRDRVIRIWDLVNYECIEMFHECPRVLEVFGNSLLLS